MKTLETLLADADERLRSGDFGGALRRYHAILASEPRSHEARMGVADALAALGHDDLAAQVYRAAAWAYAQAGHPLKAIVAAKAMAAHDQRGEEDAKRVVRLFAADSSRVAENGSRRGPIALEAPAPTTSVLDAGELPDVVRNAAAEAVELPALSVTLEKFAPAPLLSELEAGWAEELVGPARLLRLRDAEPCLLEGETPQALYLVARGRLVLSISGREIGRANEGALVGEEPLVGAPGALASAWADGDVDLLEIPYEAVAAVTRHAVGSEETLGRLLRAHFLQTLLRVSPLFRGLDADERVRLLERMKPVNLPGGARLAVEQQPSPGVWLVLSGEVTIKMAPGAEQKAVHRIETQDSSVVFTVGPGGLVGVASSLTGEPATATSAATSPVTAMFLPAEALREIVDRFPEMRRDLVEEAFSRRRIASAARSAIRPRGSSTARAPAP